MPKEEFDDEIAGLLNSVIDHFDKEDRFVRERQIRHWRRLKLYWNSFSQVYWSESAQDYRIYNRENAEHGSDQEYYDKPVNVFRAFLETIIAALSIQVPAISCVPDDAENPLDLSTAKAGDKIAEQSYKHSNAIFLWLQALYVHCTEGMVACHTYTRESKEYGTYQEKDYKDEDVDSYVCPYCNERIPDNVFPEDKNEFDADGDNGDKENLFSPNMEGASKVCPDCGEELPQSLPKTKLKIPRFVGVTDKPKSRVCLDVYGGLYVKVASYAKKQENTPYLSLSYETHYANAMEMFDSMRDQIPQGGWAHAGVNDPWEQQGRLNTQYRGDFPENNVTVSQWWLRPSSFNVLSDDQYEKLREKFPNGAKVSKVNDTCVKYEKEALDDHWTLTRNPLSDYLTHDPLGELITNIQDIINDLISLTLQTIEHGIIQTWADPAVVNFGAYNQIEAAPGTISPTKPVASNKSISEAFYSSKSAILAPEIFQLYRIIQELGQFVSGALPALFGGQQARGASKTASEYAMSKGQALQRLQTPWKMLTIWWKEIYAKVIPQYMKILVEGQGDERIVEKDKYGNFVNVFIRKAELGGKIGSVELEASEQLPISDEQQKEIILQLMQVNNAEIMQALTTPENLGFLRKVIKIPQFKLPGEDDRQKQYEEINMLLATEPIVIPPTQQDIEAAMLQGMPPPEPQELPSVEVDELVDNHDVEGPTCRSWLVSDAGRLAKEENPPGYKNVLLHFKMHMDISQQKQQEQMQQMLLQNAMMKGAKPPGGDTGKPQAKARPQNKKPNMPKPTSEGSNVRAPIS